MNTPIRSLTVAAHGLDLLHQTRLKLACSMLLAERMDVQLQDFTGQAANLLVIAGEQPEAASVVAQARTMGIPVLIIVRHVHAPGQIAHGATVTTLNERLSQLLRSNADAQPVTGTPLLLALAGNRSDKQIHLLQRGALMIALDPLCRSLALPSGLTLNELVEQLDDSSWSSSTISTAEFDHQYIYRLPQRQSLETLFFSIARRRPELLPAAADVPALQLEHWPDLGQADVPANWLLAIACLHARPWQVSALATACGLSTADTQALIAAALASDLASIQAPQRASSTVASQSKPTGLFAWVARRFGLNLPGALPA